MSVKRPQMHKAPALCWPRDVVSGKREGRGAVLDRRESDFGLALCLPPAEQAARPREILHPDPMDLSTYAHRGGRNLTSGIVKQPNTGYFSICLRQV
jgi:hypothetical protein